MVAYIGGARHAFFFALPMLLIGEWIGKRNWKRQNKIYVGLVILFLSFGFLEATLIKSRLGMNITLDVSIFGWMPAIPLFLIGLTNECRMNPEKSRSLRKITDIVYIIHIWVLTIINKLLELGYLMRFFIVAIVSFGIATVIILIKSRIHKIGWSR